LNVAPEAALSLLVGQAVTDALRADPHTSPSDPEAVALAVATAITVQACVCSLKFFHCLLTSTQVGFISFALGFFRLGFIDVVLSRALLRGFVAAIAFIILMSVHAVALCTITTHVSPSEQLIPMLGLTALEHTLKPQTTMEKIYFLVENGFTHSHRLTAFVSACALVSLVVLRMLKASLRRYKWITCVPEVLIVVIVSTSAFL
jgi:MFS superfamily sulfate permease-like transporter